MSGPKNFDPSGEVKLWQLLTRNDFPPVIYLAWAWMIVVGALLLTPNGWLCIECGQQDPGYIGDIIVNILGIGSIIIGASGLIDTVRRTRAGG